MAHSEIIADLMAKLRHSRSMIELFGVDHAEDFNQGESSPTTPHKNTLTKSSSYSDTRKATRSEFLRSYPALMDPRKFLQLITKYTTEDILLWANQGRQLPILSSTNMYMLRKKVLKLMGQRTPGGEDTLKKIVNIVKSHNRLDGFTHRFTQIRPEVVCMNMDAWYECVSQSTTPDLHTLPLYIRYSPEAQQEALTLLLGNSGTQRISLISSELLHDPLCPYRSLQDIPDDVLLELCASHSYPHVLDKLKVNNPCIKTTQENIETRIRSLIRPPVLWIPEVAVESTAEDDSMSIDSRDSLFTDADDMDDSATPEPKSAEEYFEHCGTCLDNGMTACEVGTGLRQPGQRCSRCESLGEPCEDRSPREHHASLNPETSGHAYHMRQRRDGHMGERVDENKRLRTPSLYRVFTARQHLYLLLLDESSGRHGPPAKTSMLCLPRKKPDEAKILALIGSISEPCDTANLVKEQAVQPSASNSDKKNLPVAVNAGQSNEDDEMEDDTEETIMITCGKLAERW
jgi:hypothetical protein